MMLRGLLGRRLLRGLNNRFGFAENSKLANKPTIKTVPAYDAKWKAGLMDPKLFQEGTKDLPFGQDIPERQLLTAEQMKNFAELEKQIGEYERNQMAEAADHILSLEYVTFLHYLARSEPELREVFVDRELDAAETKAFVQQLRKPQIKYVEPVKLQPIVDDIPKPPAPPKDDKPKPQQGKPPAGEKPQKGGKK